MIEFEKDKFAANHAIWFSDEDIPRLLTVLKRGSNTQSPPDMEIIKLIQEMEK